MIKLRLYLQEDSKHRDFIYYLTFSPDQELLASASDGCKIKIWKLK